MKDRLILASASPRRKELLEQIGAEFEILPAKGEEIITSTRPEQAVLELSAQKAAEVAERFQTDLSGQKQISAGGFGKNDGQEAGGQRNTAEEAKARTVILGADTVVAFEERILGKPKDEADAVRMLQMLSGSTHSVFTGVTLVVLEGEKQETISFYEETKVVMYPMTEEQIRAYVATKEPMDKAGAYAIQGKFAVYIEKIVGDYNNVVGLPVAKIYQEMEKSGIEIL